MKSTDEELRKSRKGDSSIGALYHGLLKKSRTKNNKQNKIKNKRKTLKRRWKGFNFNKII